MTSLNPSFTAPKERFLYRIKFTKGDAVKFISHLDIMRLFQRANRRSSLPIAYSKGFNPHQIMSFASPLTLGTTSEGEYADFEMSEKINSQRIASELNPLLPPAIQVTEAVLLDPTAQKGMSAIAAARYLAYPEKSLTPEIIHQHLSGFLTQTEIIAPVKTKRKQGEADIRSDIYQMEYCDADRAFHLFLAAGSSRNLKPEPVLGAFYAYCGLPFPQFQMQYHRLELYRQSADGFVSLGTGVGIEVTEV